MKATPLILFTGTYVYAMTGDRAKALGLIQHWRGAMIWSQESKPLKRSSAWAKASGFRSAKALWFHRWSCLSTPWPVARLMCSSQKTLQMSGKKQCCQHTLKPSMTCCRPSDQSVTAQGTMGAVPVTSSVCLTARWTPQDVCALRS